MGSFSERLQMLSIEFVPFVMAVVFHEFAHGLMAKKWGDTTAQKQGRLTLNPIPHMELFGTLIFPIICMLGGSTLLFGWAKPVPINPNRFKKYRPGLFWVSLAGPGMNFSLAILSALAFSMMQAWMPGTFYLYEPLVAMAYVSVSLNYALGIFNLLPLPPLDGSKIVESILPSQMALKYEAFTQYSSYILLALLLSGAFSILRYPIQICTEYTLLASHLLFSLLRGI